MVDENLEFLMSRDDEKFTGYFLACCGVTYIMLLVPVAVEWCVKSWELCRK